MNNSNIIDFNDCSEQLVSNNKENIDSDYIRKKDYSLLDFDPLSKKKNISFNSDILLDVFKTQECENNNNVETTQFFNQDLSKCFNNERVDVSMEIVDNESNFTKFECPETLDISVSNSPNDTIPLSSTKYEIINENQERKIIEMGNTVQARSNEETFPELKDPSNADFFSIKNSSIQEFHTISRESYQSCRSRTVPITPEMLDNFSNNVKCGYSELSDSVNSVGQLLKMQTDKEINLKVSSENDTTSSIGDNTNKTLLAIIGFYENVLSKAADTFLKSKAEYEESLKTHEKERTRVLEELHSAEDSFSKLHARYEKLRLSCIEFNENQKKLLSNQEKLQESLETSERRYENLRIDSENKVSSLSRELTELLSSSRSEVAILQKTLELDQLKINNLTKSVEEKERQIQELTKICDELLVTPK